MNILLTNDDGIASDGIQQLAKVLRSRGKYRVFVIAPDADRSGISHAVSLLNGPARLTRLEEDCWSCSGYPVDCVIIGLKGLLPVRPDLVLSGINRGENLGTDIIYSGTAAAARQASLSGIPALALSLAGKGVFYWDMAASWIADNLEKLIEFWEKNTFVNINIPNNPDGPAGVKETRPAVKTYGDNLAIIDTPDGNSWCFLESNPGLPVAEEGSDCDIVSKNNVSISSVYNYPMGR